MVCTASREHRRSCHSSCDGCLFLKPDRRGSRTIDIFWTSPERRMMSHLLPGALDFAVPGGAVISSRNFSSQLSFTLLTLLLSFNFLDVLLTVRALDLGIAEANPVMAGLFNLSVSFGMAAKFIVVGAGALLLWKYRKLPIAYRGMNVLTACYGAVVLYHLAFQLGM